MRNTPFGRDGILHFIMRALQFAVVVLLVLPLSAYGAGFAKQSLFLSKSPVTEGERVLIHGVVQNDTAAAFEGDLVFSVKKSAESKEKIGAVAVSMGPGEARAVSVSWEPIAGDQQIVAELTEKSGIIVATESAIFSIAEKPVPSKTDDLLNQIDTQVESSAEIKNMIASFSPSLADATGPFLLAIDSIRLAAGGILDQGIAWSKTKVGDKNAGQVLGSATGDKTPGGIMDTLLFFGAMISLYVLSVLKWIVANAGVFYPVLALVFLISLWKILSRIRRPS